MSRRVARDVISVVQPNRQCSLEGSQFSAIVTRQGNTILVPTSRNRRNTIYFQQIGSPAAYDLECLGYTHCSNLERITEGCAPFWTISV